MPSQAGRGVLHVCSRRLYGRSFATISLGVCRPVNTEILDRKLQGLESRYEELNVQMASPETAADPALLLRYGKEYASLTDVVESYRALQDVRRQVADTEQLLGEGLDEEMRALAYAELDHLRER